MLVNTYHLILSLQDFSPDNSAASFFYGMDGEIFLAGGFRMVIVGTLLRVSFILCGTVCYGCSHRYFFFFLFFGVGLGAGCSIGMGWSSSSKALLPLPQNSGMGVASGSTSTGDGAGGTGRLF